MPSPPPSKKFAFYKNGLIFLDFLSENPETGKFCRECGTKLILLCSICHVEDLSEDTFRGECGKPLSPSEIGPKRLFFDEKFAESQRYLPKGLNHLRLFDQDV